MSGGDWRVPDTMFATSAEESIAGILGFGFQSIPLSSLCLGLPELHQMGDPQMQDRRSAPSAHIRFGL